MKLYHSPSSPYVRKVMIVLEETGQRDQVELIGAAGTPVDHGTMPIAQNPLCKIPALERADGPALYDSRVICRYLDAQAGGALYPQGDRLWDALTLEATADGIVDAAILMVYEGRTRPEELHFAPWVEGQWAKAARAVEAMEAKWISHLTGPLDIGHIATACALGYLDFRHTDRNWRATAPQLAAWFAEFAKRPSFVNTAPPA